MQRSSWHGTLIWALGALAVTFVAIMAINQAVLRPLVVNAVVFLALAVAVARWPKRWLYVVTGVLAVLALVANVAFTGEDLLRPETFTTFVPTVLILLAALVAAARPAAADEAGRALGDERALPGRAGRPADLQLHLGSGNILMEPNDQYLCVVPARGGDDRETDLVYLPFEGDQVLALILSKAVLLAEDRAIADPTITRQITAGA